MSQYQARTGPIQNNAAGFSPEMAAGAAGSNIRPRNGTGRQIGQPLLPTTPIAAPFAPPQASGAQGVGFDAPARQPYARISSIIPTPHIAQFSPEMFRGCAPERPRLFLGPRIGQPLSQTTHISAAFAHPMASVVAPDRPRIARGKQTELPLLAQVSAFSFESVLASRLGFRTSWQRAAAIQPMVPEAIHDNAAFSVEMADGASGGSSMRPADRQMSRPIFVDITTFQFESIFGNQPSRPRLFLGPRIGQPLAQTTQVNAPISYEMFSGQLPQTRANLKVRQHPDPFVIQVTSFAFESIFGCKPDSPRLFRKNTEFQTAFGTFQFSHQPADFSPEMSAGAVGSNTRRIASQGSQWGQTLAQPTHVSAPFSLEMIAGNIPLRYRWKPSTRFQQPFLDLATVFNILNAMSRTSTRAVDLPYSTQVINLPYSTEQE